ncbi:hypothetical protein WISP_139312 [Willisornis vidua]|uniref:Uncharacterized protein n=1 Tax=Willisornis vidua TaxID=1566151 RepID=A0ABQ9CS95_9PASS|nr:hypothetical protein WISP_139312 [Willisornis vidua]
MRGSEENNSTVQERGIFMSWYSLGYQGEEQLSSAASRDSKLEKITIGSIENISFGSSYENAIHPVYSLYALA